MTDYYRVSEEKKQYLRELVSCAMVLPLSRSKSSAELWDKLCSIPSEDELEYNEHTNYFGE